MKKTTIAVLLAFGVIAAALVVAQTPPTSPNPQDRAQHHVQFLTTVLSLTAAQQQQATTIFTNAATAEKSLHDQIKTARDTLHTAVKNNDGAAIDQAAASIGNLTTQLTSTEAKANAAFYAILNADQQNKLQQLEQERHGRGMGPGPMGAGPHH